MPLRGCESLTPWEDLFFLLHIEVAHRFGIFWEEMPIRNGSPCITERSLLLQPSSISGSVFEHSQVLDKKKERSRSRSRSPRRANKEDLVRALMGYRKSSLRESTGLASQEFRLSSSLDAILDCYIFNA